MSRGRTRRTAVSLVGLVALAGSGALAAPTEDDEPEEPKPGVFATFSAPGAPGTAARRLVPDLTANWGAGSPDPRVPADDFRARWTGLLLVPAPGEHRFFARTDGTVRLKVAGRVVLEGDGETAAATPVKLPPASRLSNSTK